MFIIKRQKNSTLLVCYKSNNPLISMVYYLFLIVFLKQFIYNISLYSLLIVLYKVV